MILITAIKYEDTNDYHWPLINTKDETSYVGPIGYTAVSDVDPRGPFGFGDAVQLTENKVQKIFRSQLLSVKKFWFFPQIVYPLLL